MKEMTEKAAFLVLCIAGLAVPVAGAGIIIFLVSKGWNSLDLSLVFGNVPVIDAVLLKKRVFNGLFPAVTGSFLLVLISVSISLPAGMGAAIYFSEYASERVKKAAGISVDVLASAPSIVIGLAGFSAAIIMHRHISEAVSPCLLLSAISLAVLTLPYIVRSTQLALESVPANLADYSDPSPDCNQSVQNQTHSLDAHVAPTNPPHGLLPPPVNAGLEDCLRDTHESPPNQSEYDQSTVANSPALQTHLAPWVNDRYCPDRQIRLS